MSEESKAEAVAYWNDLAAQLQEIVHKNNYHGGSNQNLHIRADDHICSIYSNSPVDCQNSTSIDPIHCDPTVMNGLPSSSNSVDPVLVTPAIKQAQINQFHHQENLLDKAIFDSNYLDDSPVSSLDICKDHHSSLLSDKLNSDALNSISTGIPANYALSQQSLSSTSCPSSQNDSNIPTDDQFDLLKHSTEMLAQVPSHQMSSHILNFLPNNSSNLLINNANKIEQADISSSTEFDNVLVANSLGCPRTAATMIDEIGNGQFDRGPKSFDDVDGFANFHGTQPINLNSNIGLNTFVSVRNELFTQSDRPLQPIQVFNSSPNYYFGHPQSCTVSNHKSRYFCNLCNQQLNSQEEFERHELIHSPSKDEPSPERGLIEKASSSNTLEIKQEIITIVDNEQAMIANNQHTCEVCGKSGFSTKGNLKRHLRAHSGEKPFKCEYCPSCFTEKKSLKIHVRRHTGEKPYKCEICGKEFSQTGVLQSHMALHLNERKFDCHRCGKAFRQRSQLNLHLLRHEGVKRLTCQTCMAKFLTKGDLERHCRIHTGERPYACKICQKTFTRQQSLNEHMNRHTGRKPYDCKYCDKTFSEMSACYKHAKTHKRQDQIQQQPQQKPLQHSGSGSTQSPAQ